MEKRSPIFDKVSKSTPPELKRKVVLSFAISQRILEILEYRGISQAELARMLSKSESEISKWMSGVHNFTSETIAKIEVALDEDILTIAQGFRHKPLAVKKRK
ncbi:helix-turn-helix domain-containing protein [Chitinophaga sp. 22536]|uniref:helix-turn-helix domain-containing protein n=1 Tax=unclassified Chitinophaga TaxID=2619133 RepID=UPI0031E40B4B